MDHLKLLTIAGNDAQDISRRVEELFETTPITEIKNMVGHLR